MRHTIIIEMLDETNAEDAERILTRRLEMTNVPLGLDQDGNQDYGSVRVIEYHHEQMTEPSDEPEEEPERERPFIATVCNQYRIRARSAEEARAKLDDDDATVDFLNQLEPEVKEEA